MPVSRQDLVAALERTARGDKAAFRLVYEATSLKLYGIVVRILGRRDLADEVLQEVYVRVWQRAGDFDTASGSPITWLAAIARNRATDYLRRMPQTKELTDDLLNSDAVSAPALSVRVASAPDRMEALAVLAAIRALPDAYRETLVLRLVEGMTGPEIAARTGLTAASVRVNLHRGMKQLRERLRGSYE